MRNGVDAGRYGLRTRHAQLEAEHGLKGKFVIGYIGTHGLAHALDQVIESAFLLKNEKNIQFLFAGAGAARASLIEQAGQLGLSNVTSYRCSQKNAYLIYGPCAISHWYT